MGNITLKEVDESTDRVYSRVEDNAAGVNTFMNIGSAQGYTGARKLSFSFSAPKPNQERLRFETRCTMPILKADGLTYDYGLVVKTIWIPPGWDFAQRRELMVMDKYLSVNTVMVGANAADPAGIYKALILPT